MKKIALGWSVALAASFALAGNAGGRERCFRLYNVVPMYLGHEVEQAKACVEMYERTGEDLALYSLTLHPEGRPAQTKVDRYVASYRAFARALEGTGVRPGVLVQAILGHWPRTDKDVEPWERTIDQDGKAVRFCPLDPGFAAYVDYVFKSLAAERPAFILTDDDVRAFSHGAECFCRTHVRIFNERHNTDYDSDGLRVAVAASKPGEKVYDGFFALQREMMHEAVVGRIRRAIDSVDASLPAGFCIASEETCLAAPMAKGIAARGQVPVMRCATGCYAERLTAQRCPESFLRQMAFCEFYRGSDVDLLDEADTCPQNLWSKSARSFFTHMATACFAGMRGAKTWYVNSIRATGIPVTRAYTDVLAENRGFLDALAREVEGSHPVGVAIPCFTNRPAWHVVGNHEQCMVEQDGIFENYLAAFGIPGYACREFGDANRVFALTSAAEVDRMTDEELTRLLSGKVLVLRDAAVALTKRGLSWMTGVTAEMKPLLFNGERDCVSGAGFGYSPALSGSVEFRMAEGAERLSDLTFRPYAGAPEPEIVAPATVFYRNRLGGETITMAYHHRMYALQKFSEGRKRQLIALVDRLAGGPRFAVCENDQDVMTAERLTADGHHLMLVVNLSSDPIRSLKLRVPAGARLERLMPDGAWKEVSDDVRLEFYEAAVFRCLYAREEECPNVIQMAVDGMRADAAGARVDIADDGRVTVSAERPISTVTLAWTVAYAPSAKVLGDAWERTYGDTYWRGICEKRDMPWYFLIDEGGRTEGWGVETQPNALAVWRATTNRVELVLDVRAGGQPVKLNGRMLDAVRIVRAQGYVGESTWEFGRRFCRIMCPRPRLPKEPVYGYNDWYCAYGKNTATNFLADAAMIVSLSEGIKVRPYVVMDDGWQKNPPSADGGSGHGPWDEASANFGMAMPEFAARIVTLGAKPGLWYRPFRAWDGVAREERLLQDERYFDPTVPSVKERIYDDVSRFREWGFKLVKIDYLTYDISRTWPRDFGDDQLRLIGDECVWRDCTRTTAEVMNDLYRTLRKAAGDEVVIIGCNALNHLAAGLFEVQRTGDDTSGKDWNWTRNHGVNTLAMRSIQDGAFFKIDADCVGLAEEGAVPWELNRQWMDLLGRSGTPFFVSWRRQLAGPEVRKTLAKAFRRASSERPTIEPVDWFETRVPTRWRDAEGPVTYKWNCR